MLGGAVGLYVAAAQASRHPGRPARCSSAIHDAAACIGHATGLAMQPLLLGAAIGAVIGLALATVLVLATRRGIGR